MPPHSGAVIEALAQRHREFLRFVERRVPARADAEEILQSAFVRVFDHAGALREDERATAWFYRILRNGIADWYRSARREGLRVEADVSALAEDPTDHPESEREVCRCVLALAQGLKPEYADALRRVDVEGLSPADFALRTGITPNNARVRLHRAREALREQVHRACRTCATHGCLDCSCGGTEARGHGGTE